jgi:tetratricopeptide (TPR) repeat protein
LCRTTRARDPAEKRRLAALLAAVEAKDDALAARWRSALVTSDNQALLKLVKDTPASALSATSIQHLADDLVQRGAVDAAVALLQQGQERFPADFWIHHDLGMALRTAKPPRLDLAARHLTAAVALRPRSSGAHLNLGLTLFDAKDYDGAGRCFRAALAINDGYWQAHLNLGNVFAEKKNYPAAVAEYERAIELHANYPRAHYQLGIILRRQNKLDKAIRAFEKAIELKEDYVQAHVGLGNALKANKDVDGAVRCFRKAIDINPKYASAHFNLGNARFERREYAEAMRCYHAAIAADPNFGLAHAALGQTLLLEGQFEAALTATEKAQALIGPGDSARPLLEKQHKRCHDMLALDQKVAAVLRGEITPATPADGINYAHLCQLRKKCYAAAARLYADAFAAEPALADDMIRQHRYNAACAAACAAAGQGKDAANLSAEQRGALRQQAYDWLRADLDYWSKDSGQPADFATTRSGMLEFWIFDADLTSVRYPRALASLPAAERDRWLQFWREVAKLAH